MMPNNDDDTLIPLHTRWLEQMADAVDQGATADDAAESMLTIAVTGLMRVHGSRHVAARLVVVAQMLTDVANKAAVEGHSDDRTRH
jgi:hypothetical protein